MAAGDNSNSLMTPPPGTDPQTYARILRQQQIAEALQNEALTPTQIQQPQGSNRGFYQAARVSPLSTFSRLAAALMAKKAMDTSTTNTAQMLARSLQSFDPNSPGGQTPTPISSQGAAQPAQSAAAGGQQSTPATQQPGQTISPSGASVNPMNPMGQDPRSLMRLYMSDPQKYLDQIKGTPEWQTALAANGGNVQAAQNALKAELAKKGTLEMRSGGAVAIPDATAPSGHRIVRSPNLGVGQEALYDASGNPVAVRNIPGATEAERATAEANTTGKNQGEIHEFPTTGGGSRIQFGLGGVPGAPTPAAPAPQLPGAPNGAGPGATASPKKYFPPQPPMPGAQQAVSAPATAPATTPPGVTPGIWRGVPARPNTSGIGEDPYVAGQVKTMVAKNDELTNKYGSEADLADQRIAFNNEALKVLNGSVTGPLSDTLTNLSARAKNLGVSLPWLPTTDEINNTAELKKFLLRNPLLSLKPTFGGRPAASEFQILANDASPSPQMLKGAISRLVQLDNQSAGFSKQRSMDYAYYHDQLQGNPQRFESWYANRVPFAQWLANNPNGRQGEQHVDVLPTRTINGVTYEQLGPGQWRPKQGGQ